jgi:hypothetical protein
MILSHNAIANILLARGALDDLVACPFEKHGDEMIVEIAGKLCETIEMPVKTEGEMFLAVMLALAIERLRVQEGFAA